MTRSEGSGFLRRWSERKRAARHETPEESQAAPEAVAAPEPFDPASLPALDELNAKSDYTAFLRPGVPLELTKAALRQAWRSDPVISTFKEMADYDWDFNAPGYGALLPTDDVQAMLGRIIDRPTPPTPEPPPADGLSTASEIAEPAPKTTNNFVAPPLAALPQSSEGDAEIAALQHNASTAETHGIETKTMLRRPRHGGALPN